MGFFAGLDAEKYDRQYSDRQLARRAVAYFKPVAGKLAWLVLFTLIVAGCGALLPIIVSNGIDSIQNNPAASPALLIAGLVLLVGVTGWCANWAARRLAVRAIATVVYQLAVDAFAAASSHDLSFYDQFSSGKVASRITSDTQDFGQLVTLINDTAAQLVESLILVVVLLNIDPLMTLYLLAIVPVVVVLTLLYRNLARKVTRNGMRAMANVNSTIKETVSGISVAKNFRQEAHIYTEFMQANRTAYNVNVRRGLVLTIVFPTLNALGGLVSAALVYFGGLSVAAGAVTIGAWYMFLMSFDRFLFPVLNLASFWTQVQNGLSAAERVFALIDAEPAVTQVDAQPAGSLRGEVEFDHVTFEYKTGERVLDDFKLRVKPGETLALVGHTGAGKSSIAKLIARFYEFQSGNIRIDGRDIRSFDLTDYRKHLGIVSQSPFLFSGSVLENIRYAVADASRAEIESIAHQIGGGEWLETLPDGLDSEVGERGARLSMGQRQLVSLMRVLVQKPAIFILDEATASIDPFTEVQIQQALNLILKRTTSFLIAHRLSTVRSADRIIVIEKGRIIEEGSHDGLLARGGHYATLYNTYFRHQSLEYIEQARERLAISS
ncbi:ABC-type multidrug transport system, ATPase and permease component [Longilinea arvoryzae]|uniref:ABC-type multidrug transport system, ATPase and permease component n=1 Tax=Longilinea arvoryzae TaxID=360412 RepID=A0A0K8MXU5_9CHLR|nr:ABC transporter ATP-binding protein [Longilinea arvoryzae]GAP16030.1 ABC-type multidrug transport system, ATPase and permease component [Longilinea arvoryzae]